MAASVKQRIAFGERAGEKVRRIGSGFGDEGERPELKGPRCASVNGFSLHANTEIPAHRRDQLERLIRYTARGAVSLERLEQDANGDLIYRFNRPWSDGTTGIKLSPLELLEKLAALVPLPRAHLVRYAGCLAPHSKLRAAIIPTPRQQGVDGDETKIGTPYWNWARLLGRVFDLDMATCPFCHIQTAAHLVEGVIPWVPTRQWVVSVPIPLRSWTAPSRDLTAQVHGIIRTTIAQFYVNQAVKRGVERHKVQPGSVTFLQRFGGSLNANLHYHVIVIEGVFVDRTDQGLKPRFIKGEPPRSVLPSRSFTSTKPSNAVLSGTRCNRDR